MGRRPGVVFEGQRVYGDSRAAFVHEHRRNGGSDEWIKIACAHPEISVFGFALSAISGQQKP
jgi:hypothetical protein